MPYNSIEKRHLNNLKRKLNDETRIHDKLYNVWRGIKKRCLNSSHYAYEQYGGRGISMCNEWLDNFGSFYDWALKSGYAEGLTIDRIDNNGNYCPENCRWVNWKTQGNNRRTNKVLEYNGESHTIAEWARIIGVSREMLWNRLNKYGWTVEESLTIPPGEKRKEII